MKKLNKVQGLRCRLKQAVADSNLSMTDISRKSGLSRSRLWSYLIDDVSPSVYSLARLSKTLDVSSDWLLGLKEDRK